MPVSDKQQLEHGKEIGVKLKELPDTDFRKKRLYSIVDHSAVNDFALSDSGRKALAYFVSNAHWNEFLEWYENEFGVLPPGVDAQDAYVAIAQE